LIRRLRRNCAPPTHNCQSHPQFSLLTKPATRRNSRIVKSDSPNILPCVPLGRAFVAAASTSHHTATSFKRMGGRAAYRSGLENRQTLKSLVGSNPTLSANLPKPSREAAARPKCSGNDRVITYAGIAVSSPKAAVCRWIGSESAQVSQDTRPAAEHLNQPNRSTKPDSIPAKISPKCCLPSSTLHQENQSDNHPSPTPPVHNARTSRRVEPNEVCGAFTLPKATCHKKQSDPDQSSAAGVNPQLPCRSRNAELRHVSRASSTSLALLVRPVSMDGDNPQGIAMTVGRLH
jgi:hypothetical protein